MHHIIKPINSNYNKWHRFEWHIEKTLTRFKFMTFTYIDPYRRQVLTKARPCHVHGLACKNTKSAVTQQNWRKHLWLTHAAGPPQFWDLRKCWYKCYKCHFFRYFWSNTLKYVLNIGLAWILSFFQPIFRKYLKISL